MAARSEPVPGSVMAMAVMSSPEQIPGSQRAFCSSSVPVRKYGRQTLLWRVKQAPLRHHAGPGQLLGHHHAEDEVGSAPAAVLGGGGDAEETRLAGLAEHRLVDDTGPFPVLVVGHDLLGHERGEALAEQLVGLVEEGAPHQRIPMAALDRTALSGRSLVVADRRMRCPPATSRSPTVSPGKTTPVKRTW